MGMSDMWISAFEGVGEKYEMGTIDREEAEASLTRLGLDLSEIQDHLDSINTDHLAPRFKTVLEDNVVKVLDTNEKPDATLYLVDRFINCQGGQDEARYLVDTLNELDDAGQVDTPRCKPQCA